MNVAKKKKKPIQKGVELGDVGRREKKRINATMSGNLRNPNALGEISSHHESERRRRELESRKE